MPLCNFSVPGNKNQKYLMSIKDKFYVVGIGSSAGGFEALTTFFKELKDNSGAAFVIIQHLSPSHDSQVHKILSNFTAMPVVKVTKNMPVKPDHVYVIPENKKLKMNQEGLYLEERGSARTPNLSIDTFFESLANVYEEKAVGIVLSGTGSDGARGVQTIKARGGMVMVQSPQSASFDSMPNVSISSDHPDFISPPEVLARELAHYLKHPEVLDKEKLKKDVTTEPHDSLKEIIHLISSYSGVNFRNYKPGTIIRRIEKRMKINHIEKLSEYEVFLQQHPKEVRHIFDDLLIGVTRFFRDREAWESLEKNVIPALCEDRTTYEPVRIWVTSCSTGEEAYSLAMLFDEYITALRRPVEFKIFATDVNQNAIDIASAGRYSNAIEEDIGSARLKRYFTAMGDFFEVKKEIRRRIIFSKHNVLTDPPFIRLDLISCRNLFIYLNDKTQDKVLHNFNYALNEGGYFFLGLNESNNEQDTLFEPVDAKNKIFRNKARTGYRRPYRPVNIPFQEVQYVQQNTTAYRKRVSPPVAEEQYANLLAEKFAPPSLLVNHQDDVVYTTGRLDKYVQFPNRRSDLNVYSMLSGNLLLVFRNGIRQIQEGRSKILFADTIIENGEEQYLVDVVFSRIDKQQPERNAFLALVEFHDKGKPEKQDERVEVVTRDKYSQAEIENLEMELKLARRELHFTADELETMNEELQSSNEEMQSANEELQSTNEELQSSNEELQTVNSELKSKVDATTILHDDMHNLFNSTQIATIFLDSGMNIRKFTPPAKKYFNIMESDVGRPIYHYSNNFNCKSLDEVIGKVLGDLQPLEQEVEHNEGHYSIMRVLPYKTESRQIKGVVITFTDITELKQNNNQLKKISEELKESEFYLKSLLDNTPDLIARFDPELKYTFVNKALQEASNRKEKDLKGKDSRTLEMLCGTEKMHELMQEVLQAGEERECYFTHNTSGTSRYYYTRLIPEFGSHDGKVQSVLSISTDITRLKQAERKLLANNQQLSEMYDRMDNFVHAIAHDLRAPLVNLKLLSQLILNEDDPKEQKIFVGEIASSVQKMDHTLNGLIQIIEIDSGEENNLTRVDFAELLERTKFELQAKINIEDANIEADFSEAPSVPYVEAYLESVLKNLISNAIKYHDPERKPEIKVKTEEQNGFLVLTVSDNGRGIDMEVHGDDLFKPFKRFHNETEGMGVGLYVIRYMVAKNGGHIEVESEKGEGTSFRVFLKPYLMKMEAEPAGDSPK